MGSVLEPRKSSKSLKVVLLNLFFFGWETLVAQLAQPHPLSWHLTPFPVSNVQAVTSHNGNYSVSCAEHGDFYNTFQVCKGCWKACRDWKHPKRKKTWVEDRDIYAKQPKNNWPKPWSKPNDSDVIQLPLAKNFQPLNFWWMTNT